MTVFRSSSSRFLRFRSLTILLFAMILTTGLSFAQAASPIRGVIVDSQGSPVAGATVALTAAGSAQPEQETVSGEDGRFELTVPVGGSFTLIVSRAGDPYRYRGRQRARRSSPASSLQSACPSLSYQ